jgi:hypothetical protein
MDQQAFPLKLSLVTVSVIFKITWVDQDGTLIHCRNVKNKLADGAAAFAFQRHFV